MENDFSLDIQENNIEQTQPKQVIQKRIGTLAKKVDKLEKELASLYAKINKKQKELARLKSELKELL